jgi:hypothetical protein
VPADLIVAVHGAEHGAECDAAARPPENR